MDLIFSCVFALGLIQYSSCIIYSEVSKELENTEIDFSHSLQENIKNCTPNSSSTITDRPIECQPKPRRKRYIAFPYGSSFSVAWCASLGFIGNPEYSWVSWAMNWGLAYDLPNGTWVNEHRDKKMWPKPLVQRRHRRELYRRLEVAIDRMGYDGRSCVLRALCESAQYFYQKSTHMVEELIRTVFSLPSMKILSFEEDDLVLYDKAHRKGIDKVHCRSTYPGCSFSLIDLALGEYSNSFNFM